MSPWDTELSHLERRIPRSYVSRARRKRLNRVFIRIYMNLILQWEPSETKFHSAESISGQTGKFLDKSSRAGDSMAYRFDGIILIIRWISFNLVGGDNFCSDERNSPPPPSPLVVAARSASIALVKRLKQFYWAPNWLHLAHALSLINARSVQMFLLVRPRVYNSELNGLIRTCSARNFARNER